MHRIGRTGRSGKRGLATTFINKRAGLLKVLSVQQLFIFLSDLTVLADLKHLLLEAGQQLPLFLREIDGGDEAAVAPPTASAEADDDQGCAYCSGLGHRIGDCPKLAGAHAKAVSSLLRPDASAQGGM